MSDISAPGTALITSASSGIGGIYADRLARSDHNLISAARDRRRLERLAGDISMSTGREVRTLTADLTRTNDFTEVERVLHDEPDISLLVNSAGVGATTPLLAFNSCDMRRMIALNVGALTQLIYAAVPSFVARGAGTIINIASNVAVAPEILNGVYAGSKAFVLVFSQSLRHEVADKGARVQVVLHGATATEFWNTTGIPIEQHLPSGMVMQAADMMDAALAGFDQGEFATIPSLPDLAEWETYEAARQVLLPGLFLARPASSYGAIGASHRTLEGAES